MKAKKRKKMPSKSLNVYYQKNLELKTIEKLGPHID